MKKSLLSLTAAFFTFCVPVKAQLIITDSLDFNQIATLLQGFGTSISNLVYNCDSSAVAQFSGVSELPNLNGMLLSTGKANDLANNAGTFSSTAFGRPGDADLVVLGFLLELPVPGEHLGQPVLGEARPLLQSQAGTEKRGSSESATFMRKVPEPER